MTGLDVKDINKISERTRCLGFHQVKGGYKEVDDLKGAHDEPVLGCPEIHGPFMIESHHLFLLIFTLPLAQCLEHFVQGDVNSELCRITKEQFSENTTVSGVAQSVVDKVVRLHREHFETEVDDNVEKTWRREDVSLLVRNFNAKLARTKRSSRSPGGGHCKQTADINNLDAVTIVTPSHQKIPPEATRSSTTTESSADTFVKQNDRELSVDENGRIKPYVDFSHFHQEWLKHKEKMQNGTISSE